MLLIEGRNPKRLCRYDPKPTITVTVILFISPRGIHPRDELMGAVPKFFFAPADDETAKTDILSRSAREFYRVDKNCAGEAMESVGGVPDGFGFLQ